MRKSAIAIMALTALLSCTKAEQAGRTVNMHSIAADASVTECVKSSFGEFSGLSYPLEWDGTEKALLTEFADGLRSETGSTAFTKQTPQKGRFSFTLPKREASTYDYGAVVPYLGSDFCGARTKGSATVPEGFGNAISYALLHESKVQTPLAQAPDPTTHILLASVSALDSQPDNLSFPFESAVAYGKMKITGFPALEAGEVPQSITISAPKGTIMRGRLWRNPDGTTIAYSKNAQSDYIRIDPKNISFNTTGFDVWFTTFPFEMYAGSRLEVHVTTNRKTATASIALSKPLSFSEGKVSSFTFNWAKGQPSDEFSVNVRIGSYNIRMSALDDGDNAWEVRKSRLWTSMENCGFDIVGLQEVSTAAQADLQTRFGSIYGMYFFSPYAENGNGDKAHGVMYRSAEYTFSDLHYFWMGPDPDKMSKSDTGASGDYNRGGFCCILTHKETGLRLFFMCTHGCLNDAPNASYAHIYEDMEKLYNTENLPSIFVGDMNASTTEAPYITYTAYWKDSFTQTSASGKYGVENTYNGYSSASGKSRIDYVFYRGNAVPLTYCCDNRLYDALYASDHFPIYVDFKISE